MFCGAEDCILAVDECDRIKADFSGSSLKRAVVPAGEIPQCEGGWVHIKTSRLGEGNYISREIT